MRSLVAFAVFGLGLVLASLPAEAHKDAAGKNKQTVIAFYNLIFRDHKPEEAFARYGGDEYIQHNPRVPDGKQAAIDYFGPYFKANPQANNEIKRAVAEGDLVFLHVHAKRDKHDRGRAIVDIFRVEQGKVVEHWDVIQDVPETAANGNSMF
jgi:predicted SnoaL-like aldol condensation-catalyzing enzyme